MNRFRFWCATLNLLLLTGCAVGLNVRVGNRQVDAGKSTGWKVGEMSQAQALYTRPEILQHWGKPNRKFMRHGQEHWVYRHGLLWWGVDVWVLLPLPVRVPVCRRKARLVFENDSLRSYTETEVGENFFGYFCGDNACRGFFGGPMAL